jgi:hypothetical protein
MLQYLCNQSAETYGCFAKQVSGPAEVVGILWYMVACTFDVFIPGQIFAQAK